MIEPSRPGDVREAIDDGLPANRDARSFQRFEQADRDGRVRDLVFAAKSDVIDPYSAGVLSATDEFCAALAGDPGDDVVTPPASRHPRRPARRV